MQLSQGALNVIGELADGELDVIPISYATKRGSIPGDYYLVDVMRVLPAIDWANSRLRAKGVKSGGAPGGCRITLTVMNGCRVRSDISPDIHIFRDERDISSVFVSYELAKAIEISNLTGVDFSDPAGILAINPAT
jgi:hypothetical protein